MLLYWNTYYQFSSVQSLSRVCLIATPWTAARQASLSIPRSLSLLKLMSIESVMPSNHLILCHPLLLLPSILPSIRVFSNESYYNTCFYITQWYIYTGSLTLECCSSRGRRESDTTEWLNNNKPNFPSTSSHTIKLRVQRKAEVLPNWKARGISFIFKLLRGSEVQRDYVIYPISHSQLDKQQVWKHTHSLNPPPPSRSMHLEIPISLTPTWSEPQCPMAVHRKDPGHLHDMHMVCLDDPTSVPGLP